MLDRRSLWQSVIGEVELSISKSSFEGLFKKVDLISINGSNIKLSVPNVFIQSTMEKRYKKLLLDIFTRNNIDKPNIIFEISSQSKVKPFSREVITETKSEIDSVNLNHYFVQKTAFQ